MADRKTTAAAQGETRFGAQDSNAGGVQGVLYCGSNAGTGLGSVLALDDENGDTHYFFVTSAGVLRTHTSLPTDTETDGSAV